MPSEARIAGSDGIFNVPISNRQGPTRFRYAETGFADKRIPFAPHRTKCRLKHDSVQTA
uniref:Uncharacterized protein n=1 Tax=Neisseria meningitidis alpha153 TaxID=663926 RepID=C6S9Q7_NEIME|nr:hypothetical protein predicted by Glimmer/Critica [Neisseria meningitidis alpha153]